MADGSGTRNSIRLAFGFEPVSGMRQQAERCAFLEERMLDLLALALLPLLPGGPRQRNDDMPYAHR